jgi:hypothetical protein
MYSDVYTISGLATTGILNLYAIVPMFRNQNFTGGFTGIPGIVIGLVS